MSGQSAGERGEARLLVLASRPLAVPADIAEIRSLLGEPVDWTTLVECTMRHGMTAQVFGRLLEAGPSEVPSDIAEAARTHIEHMRARNREVIVELVQIIDALKAAAGRVAGTGGAAGRLGLKRTTLQNKMRRLNISRADFLR